MKNYLRIFLLVLFILNLSIVIRKDKKRITLTQNYLLAQDAGSVWSDIPEGNFTVKGEKMISPAKYRTVKSNYNVLKTELLSAPFEFSDKARKSPLTIELPLPSGGLSKFYVTEYSMMEQELSDKYPGTKTYNIKGIDDPYATGKLDITMNGFHAMILTPRGDYYIDPYSVNENEVYISYYKKDFRSDEIFECLTSDVRKNIDNVSDGTFTAGPELRVYRLACAATGEYTVFHGGTVTAGMSAIVTAINRINGVFEREVSVRFSLIGNNNLIVYTNGATDPYTNNDRFAMLQENHDNLTSVIGSANYDIGHVLCTAGGGVAYLGSVCDSATKAQGVTGLPSPVGDPFYIDFISHEIGHQLGAQHTFNSTAGNCSGNRIASTAWEPGSGSTIMSYSGSCSPDNLQINSDDYFHSGSFTEMATYSQTGDGNLCPQIIYTGNTTPYVSVPAGGFNIPVSTPFQLTGSAADAENPNSITYCWEEFDLGPAGSPGNPSGNAPIFRTFKPDTVPSRTFPKVSDIVNNTQTIGELLPSYTRTLNFRLTVRDNNSLGGGVNYESIQFNVTSSAGPFVVTQPNTNVIWNSFFPQTVTWNVANTNIAPVSCQFVNIKLSTDGGYTFPVTLSLNTPNDGSESVSLPNIASTQARIKVEAIGNIFFDISNTNFTIDSETLWSLQNSGSANILRSVHFPDANTGWCVGNSGTILKTINGGENWISQTNGSSITLNSVFFVNTTTGWTTGPATGSGIWKTTNGGSGWAFQSLPLPLAISVMFVNSTTGWVSGVAGFIAQTTNGGTNWSSQTSNTGNDLNSIYFVNSTTGWAAGKNGIIVKTTNAGSNWISQASGTPVELFGINFSDANTGKAVGIGGTIVATSNGGNNWFAQTSGTVNTLRSVSFPVGSSTGWIAGEGHIILCTTNNGSSWISQSSVPSVNFNAVHFPTVTRGYIAGASGVIAATSTGGFNLVAPTNLTCAPVSTSQISLNWQDNSGNEAYFRIERSTNGFIWTLIDSVGANATGYQNNELSANSLYYYRVYAKSWFGISGYTNIGATYTNLQTLSLIAPVNNSINQSLTPNFSWTTVTGGIVYHLQISADINFNGLVFNDSTLTLTNHSLSSGILQNGMRYYWRVRAKNFSTGSQFSSSANFTTTPSGSGAAALNFDGVDDYVSVPDIPGVNNFSSTLKFSIEFWCKVNSDFGNFCFVNKGGGGGNEQYSVDIFAPELRFYVKAAGGSFTHILAPRITVAEGWVHIAAVFDYANGIMKLYKNGNQIGSASPPSSLHSNTNPFAIGVQAAPLNQFLNGEMDEVRIWNTARTQTEIIESMNCEIAASASGLTANYHFNQGLAAGTNTGINSLTDASGNGNNGTLNNFTLTGAASNWIAPGGITTGFSCSASALDFDGVNDYIFVPHVPGMNDFSSTLRFSIEFWCKVNSNTGNFCFVNKGGGGGNEQYSIDIFDSNLRFYVKAAGGPFTHIFAPRITVSEGWVHIAAVFNQSTNTMKLYKNGNQIGTANPPASLHSNTNPLALGVQAAPLNQFLNGKMDEVRIWNTELTQTEIQNNMNCEIPTAASGLMSNYHFNQGRTAANNAGITALTDMSGNNNNGILNNFSLTGAFSNWVSPGGLTSGISCSPGISEINIKVIQEGFYDLANQRLNSRDTVWAYLHSITSPYNVIDSAVSLIDSLSFTGSFTFTQQSGTYYIKVKHRNSIETWSKTGGEPFVQGSVMNYDFTDAAGKAFGNNMKQIDASPVRFGIFSGDVNQNGSIDLNDVLQIYNDATNFAGGYAVTDVNGNNATDLNDILIAYNNSANFVSVKKP